MDLRPGMMLGRRTVKEREDVRRVRTLRNKRKESKSTAVLNISYQAESRVACQSCVTFTS